MTDDTLRDALVDAHEQLLDRDQRIDALEYENDALRRQMRAMEQTRAWRTAVTLRAARDRLLRRGREV